MSTYYFRPAMRLNTPLIIGIAGPTKSGKTYSALRLATGLAGDKPVLMMNAEGARGHQYAERFKYQACDIDAPYRYNVYDEMLRDALATKPGCVIIDSVSHAHDGPGGFLEQHEAELDRMTKDSQDYKTRDRYNFAAWIKPKAQENGFRYTLLSASVPVILCMRAKEKIKIVPGQNPVDLGWQPIVGDAIAFETIFTLMLTPEPEQRGIPSDKLSQMRTPFDEIVAMNRQIDEDLGRKLAAWAAGSQGGSAMTPEQALRNCGSMPALQLQWDKFDKPTKAALESVKEECKAAIRKAEQEAARVS